MGYGSSFFFFLVQARSPSWMISRKGERKLWGKGGWMTYLALVLQSPRLYTVEQRSVSHMHSPTEPSEGVR